MAMKAEDVLVEFFVQVRDACSDALEKMSPDQHDYNPESIPWTKLEGPKGPYQRYPVQGPPEQTPDYLALIADLKAHNGKLQRGGLFYWSFSDDNVTIGRKPAKK